MYTKKKVWVDFTPPTPFYKVAVDYRLMAARSGCAAGLVLRTLRLLLEAEALNIFSISSSTGRFVEAS